ncbi:hypothetical protein JMA_32620 [Jeotgalibacillus malaysiensis]|uniref:Uncharacterized protein n=1 Tax=Jeotgalibacillus malaysiensis TaxID=1508404 RepID=A0A0B5AX33_9BACL|nr:hypothetical protein [Jeotgalibacillus malaysiensis]AJD92579.1 hypothetical protein JMA_32620 [Jeotgalibacillus malaysiensis]
MKTPSYILAALFAGLFIASFIIGPFPIPGIFYLLPALFILTTLQLFEKGKIKEGYANAFFTAIFIGIATLSFIIETA